MKIIIEHSDQSQFLSANGRWTPRQKEAAMFPTSASAKQAGAKAAIGLFNVIGCFSNSPQITNLDDGCGTLGPHAVAEKA